MEEVINAFLHLLYETEKFVERSGDRFPGDDLETFLRDFRVKRVNPLHRRMKRMEEPRYVLSMVGLTNVGKSTLSHALLGHNVAPRLNGPATATPVEYEHSATWSIKSVSREDLKVTTKLFESPEDLVKALKKMVLGPEVPTHQIDRPPERIMVGGPMELLKDGIVLADTPGFGAAHEGVPGRDAKRELVDYLESHVTEAMFCISGANGMVSGSELEFFQEIEEFCSTVIVTKWDGSPSEEKRYRDKFSDLFPNCGFIFVEAKRAIDGTNPQNVEALVDLIRANATRESRIKALGEQVASAWEHLNELAKEPLKKSKASSMPWHKAALPLFLRRAQQESLDLSSGT